MTRTQTNFRSSTLEPFAKRYLAVDLAGEAAVVAVVDGVVRRRFSLRLGVDDLEQAIGGGVGEPEVAVFDEQEPAGSEAGGQTGDDRFEVGEPDEGRAALRRPTDETSVAQHRQTEDC